MINKQQNSTASRQPGIYHNGRLVIALVSAMITGCSTSDTAPLAAPAQTDNNQPVTQTPTAAPATSGSSGNTAVACTGSSAEIQSAMSQLINEFRSKPQTCGNTVLPAADPMAWNSQLESAAVKHSVDMSTVNFFSHTGSDGLSVSQRVTAAGFSWSNVGENIAGGQADAESAVQAWIESPGHCANLVNNDFREFAVSCSSRTGTNLTHYWTLVFGTEL